MNQRHSQRWYQRTPPRPGSHKALIHKISITYLIRLGQLALITLIATDLPSAAVRVGACRVQYATRVRSSLMTIATMASNVSQGAVMLKCALLWFSVSKPVLWTVTAQMSLAARLDIAQVMPIFVNVEWKKTLTSVRQLLNALVASAPTDDALRTKYKLAASSA